jgi:DNA-directed RNA polymerase subunit RPC12/RpoP
MNIDEIKNKDGAIHWLMEKVQAGWGPSRIRRELLVSAEQIPPECEKLLLKIIRKLQERESENWKEKKQIKCRDCGYQSVMRVNLSHEKSKGDWTPETKCPRCSSDNFYPLVKSKRPVFRKYWKRNPIIATILVLITVVSLSLATASFNRASKLEKVIFMCSNCHEFFRERPSHYPLKCPACGKLEAFMAIECQNCGEIYVWPLLDWEKHPPTCPACGSKESSLLKKIPK